MLLLFKGKFHHAHLLAARCQLTQLVPIGRLRKTDAKSVATDTRAMTRHAAGGIDMEYQGSADVGPLTHVNFFSNVSVS